MRSVRTAVRVMVVAVVVMASSLFASAKADPVCASTPSGTSCVDATGSCLLATYPRVGPATCLKNPIGGIVGP